LQDNQACLLPARYDARIVAEVYLQLKGIAASFMTREKPSHILQPTALVHEAYLKMARSGSQDFQSQTHFVGCAAHVMREVLIDCSRKSNADKRRGEMVNWTITSLSAPQPMPPEDFIALDQALDRLAARQPNGARQARLIELVWLGGMSMTEAAEGLGVSRRQAHRDWAYARVWLEKEMAGA
jgi:RNA polymerase sigma factor (TIGR02999 family)